MKINMKLALLFLIVSNVSFAGAALVKSLNFEPRKNGALFTLEYDGQAIPEVREDARIRQITVEVPGVQLPADLTRIIDFAAKETPVLQITPYNSAGEVPGAKIVFQLRERVSLVKTVEAGKLTLKIQSGNPILEKADVNLPEINSNSKSTRIQLTKAWIETDTVKSSLSAEEKASQSAEIARRLEETLNSSDGEKTYQGSKVNFEANDADVHDIFKLVGATSGLNILTASDVQGKVNIALKGVPWDQLLDVILQAQQLRIAVVGSVVRVMTLATYNKELDDRKRALALSQAMEPTIMAIVPVSFAKADEMKRMIDTLLVKSPSGPEGKDANQAFERGKIEIDQRSNSLIITNTVKAIDRIKRLVKELDVPMPQILIEAKIVVANESFSRSLGVSWAGAQAVGAGGRAGGGISFNGQTLSSASSSSSSSSSSSGGLASTFAVAAAKGTSAAAGFTLGAGAKANLNVQLSIGETNNVAKTVASPKIIVNNKQSANINDTLSASYTTQSTSQGGVANETKFVSLPLTLSVTPQITNAGSVLMDLNVNKSALVDEKTGASTSKSLQTQVLVDSGSTLVLGGVYQQQNNMSNDGIPVLKDLPIFGFLFRNKGFLEAKSELLVFVTPKILDTGATGISDK